MKRNKLTGALLISPAFIMIFGVLILPIFYTIYTSMYKSNNLVFDNYVGFKNFINIFTEPAYLKSIYRGIASTLISLVVSMIFGIMAALWLSTKKGKYGYFLQLLILIPWFTSMTVSALTWRWLVDNDYGLLNFVLRTIGLTPVKVLSVPILAFFGMCFIIAWRSVGFIMMLALSGLKTIQNDVLEAARVDGANYMQSVFYIKLPSIKSQITLAFIMITLGNLNNSVIPLTFAGGGPAQGTTTIALQLYDVGFSKYMYGQASAISVFILIINVIFIIFYTRSMRYERE